MKTENEIRRELGFGLIEAERQHGVRTVAYPDAVQPDPRKRDDEQCNGMTGVDADLLKGIVLGVEYVPQTEFFAALPQIGGNFVTNSHLWPTSSVLDEHYKAQQKSINTSMGGADHAADTQIVTNKYMCAKLWSDYFSNLIHAEMRAHPAGSFAKPEERPIDVMAVTRSMCK